MAIDWNKKLAAALGQRPEQAPDLLNLAAQQALQPADAGELEAGARLSWLSSAADRVPAPVLASASAEFDWATAAEVTHGLSQARLALESLPLEALRKAAADQMNQAARRFDDSKRRFLWLWHELAPALADVSPAAWRLPADARMPDITVWQRMTVSAAMASAGAKPAFLAVRIGPGLAFTTEGSTVEGLRTGSALLAWLIWQTLQPVLEQSGPDAVLYPSLRYQPALDSWLADQGVGKATQASLVTLPNEFVALVPSAQAEELAAACQKAFDQAWHTLADDALKLAVREGWTSGSDQTWNDIWKRQIERALHLEWIALDWGDDSTSAGTLLPKGEVAAFERWVKTHQDASGLEDPWPGIFFGLWYGGARSASLARRRYTSAPLMVEPGPRCTVCGKRQALHGAEAGLHESWKAIAKKRPSVAGQCLCAVCSVRELAANTKELALEPLQVKGRYALLVLAPDQAEAIMRGGRELKQGAVMTDLLHHAVAEKLGRARSQWKELLEAVPPMGPGRQAYVAEAMTDFALNAVKIVREHGGTVLYAFDQVVAVLPVERALAAARALAASYREPFVPVPMKEGTRQGVHPGPVGTVGAAIVVGAEAMSAGELMRQAHRLLDESVVQGLGGDGIALVVHRSATEQRLFASKWAELERSLVALLDRYPGAAGMTRVLSALRGIEQVLADADVDKSNAEGRLGLVKDVLGRLQLQPDTEALARAIGATVERGAALQTDGEATHVLDGLYIASEVAGEQQ